MPEFREATQADEASIRGTVCEAFGDVEGAEISALVTALMTDSTARPVISLVAAIEGEVVGHILFSRAQIETSQQQVRAAILAPLCVVSEHQNQGIGGALIREGLSACKRSGCDLVFVLGHPAYYPKHGFVPAGPRGLDAPFPIAPENADAWMVQELRPGTIGSVRGTVTCADSLMDPKYWGE